MAQTKHSIPGLAALVWLLCGPVANAQPTAPISYTLRFPAPHTHYVEVEARFPTGGEPELELMMAVWTPGSYLVREFARHVEELTARTPSGLVLPLTNSRKNRWRLDTDGAPTIVLSYRVYSREMSVRTNWVDQDFALINGAPTFITVADHPPRPHDVIIERPPAWARSMTALPAATEGVPDRYQAATFDQLLDSPIVVGNPDVYEFAVGDIPHYLVNVGGEALWDGAQAADDVERIVRAHRDLWGHLPYERYLFLNLINESGGGLEHSDSSVLMTSRWQMHSRERYLDWLYLVSHELFHAWNVKRLRPIELGPFDYENEVYTRSLWVAEGLTVYYAPLLVHRAGLSTRDEYLSELSDEIRRLQTTPGRLVQSVEQASYDAWIRFYRRNENSPNTTVSYYTKGAVIGFLLDARIRQLTGGTRSLDDVMRLAYERYAGARGFTPHEFRATADEATGADSDLGPWFRYVLETVGELDYTPALDWFGLSLATTGETPDGPLPAWVGLRTRADGDRILVSEVRRDTPGFDAGFNVGDEIVAIDDYRVLASGWGQRLRLYRAGETASILVSRRGRLTPLDVTFGAPPTATWDVTLRTVQTPAQQHRINAWLGPVE